MKLLMRWVMSAGLALTAATANAQTLAPYGSGSSSYIEVSDVGGAYEGMLPEAGYPGPRYELPRYGEPRYGLTLLAPTEVYAILRENGFSPLGVPYQRGLIYTIAAIDRSGYDGRLIIDARTGRIIRFMPAYRMGNNFNQDNFDRGNFNQGLAGPYGAVEPLPPMENMSAAPRPPVAVPRLASRTPPVPLPKAPPSHAADIKPEVKPLAAKPAAAEPARQSAAVQDKPTEAPIPRPAAVPIVEARPAAPEIKPTQVMPKAQGLD